MGQPLPTSLYLRRPSLEGPRAPHCDHFPELPPHGFLTVLRVMGRSRLCPPVSWAKCYRCPRAPPSGSSVLGCGFQVSRDGKGRGGGYLEAPLGLLLEEAGGPRQCLPAEPAKPGFNPRGAEVLPRAAHTPQLPAPPARGEAGVRYRVSAPRWPPGGRRHASMNGSSWKRITRTATFRSGRAPGGGPRGHAPRPSSQGTP